MQHAVKVHRSIILIWYVHNLRAVTRVHITAAEDESCEEVFCLEGLAGVL